MTSFDQGSGVPATDPSGAATLQNYLEGEALAGHLRRLTSVAASILGCDHEACDAVQEALLSLWCQPVLPPNPAGWLVRTVVFRSRHALRCRLNRRRREERIGRNKSEGFTPVPARELETVELHECLERAIAALPPDLKEAFLLREDAGLDYDAIAVRTQAPVGTVRSRIHRARSRLQRTLKSA